MELTRFRDLVGNGFATVKFVKRSDGNVRKMNFRLGVKKHLRGGEVAYDPAKHNLVVVYDVQARGYRSIPLDGVLELKTQGRTIRDSPAYAQAQLELKLGGAVPEGRNFTNTGDAGEFLRSRDKFVSVTK